MYVEKGKKKKWIDPIKQAELNERDRIRQAYYADLEKKKVEQKKSKRTRKRKE